MPVRTVRLGGPRAVGAGPALIVLAALLTLSAFAADVDKLAAQLASPDAKVRREAVYELGKLGPAASAALPALITALDDKDRQVWSGAVDVIGQIGPAASEAIPELIKDFDPEKGRGRDRDRAQAQLRLSAALGQIGQEAVPALIAALEDKSTPRQAGAARSLGTIGPAASEAIPALMKKVGWGDEGVRRAADDALAAIGEAAVPELKNALYSDQELYRRGAAEALGAMGPVAAAALPDLNALAWKDPKNPVRIAALLALPRISGPNGDTINVLISGTRSDVPEIRHAAINGLLSTRALVQKALPALIADVQSSEAGRRQSAAFVLSRIGSPAASAVPALITCAASEPKEEAFTDALAAIGPAAIKPLVDQLGTAQQTWIFRALSGMGAPAIAALTTALKSPTPAVRAGAATALADMTVDAPATVQALLTLTGDPEAPARAAALRALSSIRSERDQSLPKLEAALADSDAQVRQAAAAGLARFGAVSKLGPDGLLDLMNDPDPERQRSAIQALGLLGAPGQKAIPTVIARLEVADLRLAALETLGKFGEASSASVSRVTQLAAEGSDDVRIAAIQALNGIGKSAEPALPVLYKCLESGQREIAIQSLKALVTIEPSDDALLPVVLQGFKKTQGGLRASYAAALKRFGDRAEPAAPQLLEMLQQENNRAIALATLRTMRIHDVPLLRAKLNDKVPTIQAFACEALAKLGAEAQPALPDLRRLAESGEGPARAAAKKAVAEIMKAAP